MAEEKQTEEDNSFVAGNIVVIDCPNYPDIDKFPKFIVSHSIGDIVSCVYWNGYEMKQVDLHIELLTSYKEPPDEVIEMPDASLIS